MCYTYFLNYCLLIFSVIFNFDEIKWSIILLCLVLSKCVLTKKILASPKIKVCSCSFYILINNSLWTHFCVWAKGGVEAQMWESFCSSLIGFPLPIKCDGSLARHQWTREAQVYRGTLFCSTDLFAYPEVNTPLFRL